MLEKLRTFIALADCGSYTEAARKLYCSQPSVSQHIKFLEKHYDAKLVVRRLIPSQSHIRLVEKYADKIRGFADSGRIVVTFGPQGVDWLPDHNWEFRPTNFWWWLEPGADSGLRLPGEEHDLFRNYLALADATWHQHGVYWPSAGCETLVSTADGGSVLYIDKVNSAGTWVNTTLDPDYHYGSYFMPATERFLRGFLPWLVEGEI